MRETNKVRLDELLFCICAMFCALFSFSGFAC